MYTLDELNYRSLLGQKQSVASFWVSTAQGIWDNIVYYIHDLKKQTPYKSLYCVTSIAGQPRHYGFLSGKWIVSALSSLGLCNFIAQARRCIFEVSLLPDAFYSAIKCRYWYELTADMRRIWHELLDLPVIYWSKLDFFIACWYMTVWVSQREVAARSISNQFKKGVRMLKLSFIVF